MPRDFIKMHGLGNDFVVIDGRADGFCPTESFCLKVADRHRGVGYDQLIILAPPQDPQADVFMHIYNADGSTAEACGNATRCIGHLLFKEKDCKKVTIQTTAALLNVWQEDPHTIGVAFPPPNLGWQEIPLAQQADTLNVPLLSSLPPACCVNVGNPHAVFFLPTIRALDLKALGPQLEHHPMFPARANIEFAQVLDKKHIRMRVWERGTGITQSCGSGALATHVAAVRRGLTGRKTTIILDGGALRVDWPKDDAPLTLAGPVSISFYGRLDESFEEESK
ncbi:MAG: diaminopimelate epimerase [Alphaproteobacteria bacterium]|nr:diaminopimelate epimerase [Alphaproteobacteria bacterium]